jgi:deoxyribodipyrimidine photo-lyase
VHDHPALHAATAEADRVVPLFVLDEAILTSSFAAPNRVTFLVDSLRDLRRSLRARGGDLVVRRGDVVKETRAVAAEASASEVHLTADVAAYGHRRGTRLREAGLRVVAHPGVTVVAADEIRSTGGGNYKVFTPYWRVWREQVWRTPVPAPRAVRLPPGIGVGRIPAATALRAGHRSPDLPAGGEGAGRARMAAWMRSSLAAYDDHHDDLGADDTSRLSPWLHFGCLSPLEVARAAVDRPGGEAFVRQLCWRDFHHQVAAAHPTIATDDYRPRGRRWLTGAEADDAFAQWCDGATGVPLVDAAMAQLRHEGWVHNRARLVAASYLTKTLGVDWRRGADHFLHWLVDGDIVNNSANWQWVAGTGTDTRPNRVLNPFRQEARYDTEGLYVQRHLSA